MPGIIADIADRLRMNAESVMSSFTSARMQALDGRRKFVDRLRGGKKAQESWFGLGFIPKPAKAGSMENPPGMIAETSAESAVPSDGSYGLVG